MASLGSRRPPAERWLSRGDVPHGDFAAQRVGGFVRQEPREPGTCREGRAGGFEWQLADLLQELIRLEEQSDASSLLKSSFSW